MEVNSLTPLFKNYHLMLLLLLFFFLSVLCLLCRAVNMSVTSQESKAHVTSVVACEQALRSALAAGREKEELATTSLEYEFLSVD